MQSRLDDKLRQRCSRLLSKVCKAHRILPASYLLQLELIRMGRVRGRGGFAEVSDGDYSGFPVAIKRLRTNEGDSGGAFKVRSVDLACYRCSVFTQRLCREIITWKHLSHPNILPLLGVYVSTDQRDFSILTEWMPNGDVMQYACSNPKANRLRLVRLLAVHSCPPDSRVIFSYPKSRLV